MSPHIGLRVDVYFNLRTKIWSIRHKGRVIQHARSVVIDHATAHVGEVARQRVLRRRCRSVHAVIRGTLVSFTDDVTDRHPALCRAMGYRPVSYNPYTAGHFYTCADRKPFHGARRVVFATDARAYIVAP